MRERVGYVEEPERVEEVEYVKVRERNGCWRGCWAGGCLLPLTIVTILVLTSVAVGGGCALKAGDYRAVLGGALGNKSLTKGVMPWYASGIIGRNDSLINESLNTNIGDLEAVQTLGIGKYIIAPDSSLDFNSVTR